MLKMLKKFNWKEWLMLFISVVLIAFQVWLDLKLPDYMSNITRLIETSGNSMGEILKQGGYMLLCALGSLISAIIVGYITSKLSASFSYDLRKKYLKKLVILGWKR